jgi:hypothetical protein
VRKITAWLDGGHESEKRVEKNRLKEMLGKN